MIIVDKSMMIVDKSIMIIDKSMMIIHRYNKHLYLYMFKSTVTSLIMNSIYLYKSITYI